MKNKLFSLCITLAALAAPMLHAQSTNELVRVEVRPQITSDRKDIKGSTADTKTQKVTLLISVSGKPKSPETRVLKWTIFGKDLKGNEVTKIESGEQVLALDSTGRQTIESKVASTTATPDHAMVSRASRGRTTAKKVEGSGVKYFGYGVLVKDGGTVVGRGFSGASLEAEMK